MLKKRVFSIVLITGILFSPIYLNNVGIYNAVVHDAYGHSFSPNDFASFIATMDQFLTESKLAQANIANNNLTLAQGHADKAASLYLWNLMGEIAVKDNKMAEDLTKAVKSLQNMSSPAFSASASALAVVEQQQQVNQLVADIDAKAGEAIDMTIRQQEVGSGFLDPVAWIMSSIFGEKKDGNNTTTQPLRVAELVDSALRSYGNAYDVGFDMTDISNMAMVENSSSMSTGNMMNADNNNIRGMDPMKTSSSAMTMNSDNNKTQNYSLANVAEYQSAQGLAAKALEIFNNELKPMTSDNDSAVFVSKVEDGLMKLNESVKSRASPMDVMMIAHTQIHPNLLEAFDLPLRSGV
jgi:hypothetical protein